MKYRAKRPKKERNENAHESASVTFSWLSLPTPIVINVFVHVGDPHDLLQCSLVCRLWRELLEDDYMWKKILNKLEWNLSPEEPLCYRLENNLSKWFADCCRLYRFHTNSPCLTSAVHCSPVLHASFSNSGNHVATTSHDIVVIWSVFPEIKTQKKIQFRRLLGGDGELRHGVKYSHFNQTDEFLLVSGGHDGRFQLPGDDQRYGLLYGAAVYRLPDCVLLSVVVLEDLQTFLWCRWFSRATFLVSVCSEFHAWEEDEPGNENIPEFDYMVMIYSVFEKYGPKRILNTMDPLMEILSMEVIPHKDSLQKMLVFGFQDYDLQTLRSDESFAWDRSYFHSISTVIVTSDLVMDRHTCNEEDNTCCVEAMYWSPHPRYYASAHQSRLSKFLKAGGLKIEVGLDSNVIGVLCRSYRLGGRPRFPSAIYDGGLEMRLFDLDLNLVRSIRFPFPSLRPIPSFLDHSDYKSRFGIFKGQNYLFAFNYASGGELSYFNTQCNIVLKKETGHTATVNSITVLGENPARFVTTSEDEQVKFWGF